jgi:hypothetical protein
MILNMCETQINKINQFAINNPQMFDCELTAENDKSIEDVLRPLSKPVKKAVIDPNRQHFFMTRYILEKSVIKFGTDIILNFSAPKQLHVSAKESTAIINRGKYALTSQRSQLMREFMLFRKVEKTLLEENRHTDPATNREWNKRFGLVIKK